MDNMRYNEDMQFDETDLISTQSARQVPPQRPVQLVAEIRQSIPKKDTLPKEDLGRTWNNKKSEREAKGFSLRIKRQKSGLILHSHQALGSCPQTFF